MTMTSSATRVVDHPHRLNDSHVNSENTAARQLRRLHGRQQRLQRYVNLHMLMITSRDHEERTTRAHAPSTSH